MDNTSHTPEQLRAEIELVRSMLRLADQIDATPPSFIARGGQSSTSPGHREGLTRLAYTLRNEALELGAKTAEAIEEFQKIRAA